MTIQYSVELRNLQLQVIEDAVNALTDPRLTIYKGTIPANVGTNVALSEILLDMLLPSNFFSSPSGGVMTKTGNWQGTASATGTASFFRLRPGSSLVGTVQGSVGTSSADLIVDNTSFILGQIFTIITFTITHNQS